MKELFQVSQACAVNKFPGHAIGHSIENYIHLPKNEMKYLIIQTRKKRERERSDSPTPFPDYKRKKQQRKFQNINFIRTLTCEGNVNKQIVKFIMLMSLIDFYESFSNMA